jgi:hypothetical protein
MINLITCPYLQLKVKGANKKKTMYKKIEINMRSNNQREKKSMCKKIIQISNIKRKEKRSKLSKILEKD